MRYIRLVLECLKLFILLILLACDNAHQINNIDMLLFEDQITLTPEDVPLSITVMPKDKNIFVTTTNNTTYQRTLNKYIYNTTQNNLIADSDFKPISVPGFLNLYFGFFAVSAKYALSLEFRNAAFLGYHLTPYQLNPFMAGQQIAFLDRPASRIVPTIVSAAPDSAVVMIADNKQIDVLNFDYNVGYNPVSSLMLSSPLQYLSVKHVQLSNNVIYDAVGVDKNNILQLYSLQDNNLILIDKLTSAANQRLSYAEWFLGSKIVGLTIGDINNDQVQDLIIVIESAFSNANIILLRYVEDNKFELKSITLPNKIKNVISISVGDFNTDGKTDIALATEKDIKVYLNFI